MMPLFVINQWPLLKLFLSIIFVMDLIKIPKLLWLEFVFKESALTFDALQ